MSVSVKIFDLNKECEIEHDFEYAQSLDEADYIIFFNEGKWALKSNLEKSFLPVSIDLNSIYRNLKTSKSDLFYKALGVKKLGADINVLDCTCGLGRDSLLMLLYGLKVTSLERNGVNQFLMDAALREAKQKGAQFLKNFNYIKSDAIDYLTQDTTTNYEVIYLDPMYPIENLNKSALNKKEMRIFRDLCGPDQDATNLLELALKRALKRVVVKRPPKGRYLLQNPHHSYVGKSVRYDLYLPNN